MKYVRYVLIALLGVIFILVGMFNSGNVTVDYIIGKKQLPMIVVLLAFFIFGALIGSVIFGSKAYLWRKRANASDKALKKIQQEQENRKIESQFHKDNQAS